MGRLDKAFWRKNAPKRRKGDDGKTSGKQDQAEAEEAEAAEAAERTEKARNLAVLFSSFGMR
jgi:hypothetical protein